MLLRRRRGVTGLQKARGQSGRPRACHANTDHSRGPGEDRPAGPSIKAAPRPPAHLLPWTRGQDQGYKRSGHAQIVGWRVDARARIAILRGERSDFRTEPG